MKKTQQGNYSMKNIKIDTLKNFDTEIATKYFYLYLVTQTKAYEGIEIETDKISSDLGITPSRIYRARSQLVKLGVLISHKKYCENTGKKIGDFYKLT